MLNTVQHAGFVNKNIQLGLNTEIQKQQNAINNKNLAVDQSFNKLSLENLQANYLTFRGQKTSKSDDEAAVDTAIKNFAPELKNLWKKAAEEADRSGSKEIDSLHVLKGIVEEAIVACNSMDAGLSGLLEEVNLPLSDPEIEKNVKKELLTLIKDVDALIDKLPKGEGRKELSSNLKSMLRQGFNFASNGKNPKGQINFDEHFLLTGMLANEEDPATRCVEAFFDRLDTIAEGMDLDYLKDEDIKPSKRRNSDDVDVTPFIESLTNIPLESLPSSGIYNDKARTIATAVLAGRNVVVGYDSGSMPDLLELDFARMVKTGEFKQLKPDEVDVKHINANQLIAKKEVLSPIEALMTLGKDGKKTIAFIEGFGKLLTHLSSPSMMSDDIKPDVLFNSHLIPKNVQIVGLMNNATRTALSLGAEKDIDVISLLKTIDDRFENIRLGSPSPTRVKEVLKTDPVIFNEITTHFNKDIIFDDESIDAAVDYALNCRSGSMPGKVLDLMKFVVAAKSNATDGDFETISKSDVDNFIREYPDLKQTAKSASGSFSVIHNTGYKLDDVGGVRQAKKVVEDLLDMIKNPKKYEGFGDLMTRGVLLTGSPGNGKTHLARAIAGEANVPFISVTGSDFNAKFMGVGTERVKELFAFARDQAKSVAEPGKKGTAIIFIDEFDSIGKAQSSDGSAVASDSNQTLNTLLTEMDGLNKNN
ncbi:MAG: AAA family ATPase, partial [Vampirovibrionia bacterium]